MRAQEFANSKLVIFDIDDTLVNTDTKVNVVKDGKIIKQLNSHDFTHYHLQPGEEFDFGAFRDAREFYTQARPIPGMIRQLKADIATGNKVIMLTARSDFNDREVFLDTFRQYGIDMDRVHVYRAGNLNIKASTEEKKKIILKHLLGKEHYDKIIMYDDSVPNLNAFLSLKQDYPWSKFYAWHVDPSGQADEYHRTDIRVTEARRPVMDILRRELPGWPDYVIKDWIYQKIQSPIDLEGKLNHVREIAKMVQPNSWRLHQKMPITFDMLSNKTRYFMKTKRQFGERNPFMVPRDRERLEDAIRLVREKGMENLPPVIMLQQPDGLELVEGWHRTMAAFRQHPEGFQVNAWIGQSSQKAVTEDSFQGIDISMERDDDEIMVRASAGGKQLGSVLFVEYDGYLMPQDLEVDERFRGQGIAQAMYDYVKSQGYRIRRSGQQTDAGSGFWSKHRPGQNVWEQGIEENFADGKVKGKSRPGRVKRSGASCNGSVTDLRRRAKNASGEKAKMYHWCANMKSGRKK
jgi:GNAT superfamily N-acetyltransferase